MPRYFLALSLLVFTLVQLPAQTGDYPIKDHFPSIPGIDHTNYEIAFDQHGLMYAANRSGLLRYDGSFWEFIRTPSSVFSLDVDADDRVYLGCMKSFGYLELTKNGLDYIKISPDSLGSQFFFSTQVIGDSVLFLSEKNLWVYTPSTKKLNQYTSPDKYDLVSLTYDENGLYLNTEIASYSWDGASSSESSNWIGDQYPPLMVEKSYDGSITLMLDLTGKLFHKEGNSDLKRIGTTYSGFEEVKWINDTLFAASTKDQGVIVYSAKTFDIIGQISYENGLPDDEVYALAVDWSQGIWIAHQFGFSRVDPIAPLYCLSNHEGLEGNLIQSIIYKGEIIIATSSGAFQYTADSVYSTSVSTVLVSSGQPSQTSNNKGIFGGILSRKREEETGTTTTRKNVTEKVLENVHWKYQRLDGVMSKSNDFLIHEGVLLIGTNAGLYEYNGQRTRKILNQPVKKIVALPKTKEFIILNDEFGVERYLHENGEYQHLAFGYNEAPVLSAYGDDKGLIWLVTPNHLLSVATTYYGASVLDEIDFPNEYFEDPTIIERNNKLYFITAEGYYSYNYQNKKLSLDSAMYKQLGHPIHHYEGKVPGSFWVYDGKIWNYVSDDDQVRTYTYLSLYPDITFIDKSSEGKVYFINERNELFEYHANEDDKNLYQSNIFYKHLYAQSGYSKYRKEVSLDYDQNYLRAELTQPDYLGLLKVEFQHKVEGLDADWSDWSRENKIDINFIPDGNYVLNVRSRDVFGRVQSMQPITLKISPPYWRQTWFYMLEVLFFGSLVMISARLNQNKASNRFLTEGLTVLTIIMIIEFFQSAAESYLDINSSPIFDFLINLSIALIIFPFEILLRKIIKEGGEIMKRRKDKRKTKAKSK